MRSGRSTIHHSPRTVGESPGDANGELLSTSVAESRTSCGIYVSGQWRIPRALSEQKCKSLILVDSGAHGVTRKGGDPPAGKASSHAAAGGAPDRNELGEEERAVLRRVLQQAGIKPTKEIVERLVNAVQTSMATFSQAVPRSTRRERHDALRALVHMADEEDPPVGLIRARISKLAAVDIADAEERARALWSRMFRDEGLVSDFNLIAWSKTAPVAKLLEVVRALFSDGGVVVQGRARPRGKRSKPHLEPYVLGQARGANSPSRTKAEASATSPENRPPLPGNGRPRADAEDALVMYLAIDWALITGLESQPGRSDQKPFGDLVHRVFGWLDLGTAEQSLRRYWDEVQDAEIIEIEGGQVFR